MAYRIEGDRFLTDAAGVAAWLGLSSRRVRELRTDGVIPGEAGGEFDLQACVLAYCARYRPAAGRAAAGGSDVAATLDEARIRLLTAQAEAREMGNSIMRAESVLASDLEIVAGAIVDGIRARVLAIPTRAAPLVVGLPGLAEVRDRLTGLVHEALGDLAAAGMVAAVTDRARRQAGGAGDGAETAAA